MLVKLKNKILPIIAIILVILVCVLVFISKNQNSTAHKTVQAEVMKANLNDIVL